jgi:polyisoprenoid-binding protein YceI
MSALNRELPNPAIFRYSIDAGLSRLTVRAFAAGLLSMLGHNPTIGVRSFEGDVHLAEESLAGAGLHLNVNAASLVVEDQVNDRDRREIEFQMRGPVLEVKRFPSIIYHCSSVSGRQTGPGQFAVSLNGELTLHGVTRVQPLDARVNVVGDVLRASGELMLRQTDYGIKLVSAAAGTLRVKEEVKVAFDVAARKRKED